MNNNKNTYNDTYSNFTAGFMEGFFIYGGIFMAGGLFSLYKKAQGENWAGQMWIGFVGGTILLTTIASKKRKSNYSQSLKEKQTQDEQLAQQGIQQGIKSYRCLGKSGLMSSFESFDPKWRNQYPQLKTWEICKSGPGDLVGIVEEVPYKGPGITRTPDWTYGRYNRALNSIKQG